METCCSHSGSWMHNRDDKSDQWKRCRRWGALGAFHSTQNCWAVGSWKGSGKEQQGCLSQHSCRSLPDEILSLLSSLLSSFPVHGQEGDRESSSHPQLQEPEGCSPFFTRIWLLLWILTESTEKKVERDTMDTRPSTPSLALQTLLVYSSSSVPATTVPHPVSDHHVAVN